MDQTFDPRFGHLLSQLDHGDNEAITADDFVTSYEYTPNAGTKWLVSYPFSITRSSNNGNLISREEFVYQAGTSPGLLPPDDDLVREHWVSADFGGTPETLKTKRVFDAFGNNLTALHSPRHFSGSPSTTAQFDALYNTFPILLQRLPPLSGGSAHTSQFAIDPLSGALTKRLQPNGLRECWSYNDHGELASYKHALGAQTSLDSGGGGCVTWLEDFVFEHREFGPTVQRVKTTSWVDGANGFEDYAYVDGLGRVHYESRAVRESGIRSALRREWGTRGELTCESLPAHEGGINSAQRCSQTLGTGARFLEYDPLLRPSRTKLVPDVGQPGIFTIERQVVYEVRAPLPRPPSWGPAPGPELAAVHKLFGASSASEAMSYSLLNFEG